MKTVPLSKPGQMLQAESSPGTSPVAQDARARAIAKLSGSQPNPVPVDANNVSVEELGAVTNTAVMDAAPMTEEAKQAMQQTEVETTEPASKPAEAPASEMAILARKERALRAKVQQQDQAYKAKEAALQAREEAVKAKEQEYQSGYISKQRLKTETLQALADAEVSYDEITQQVINQQAINPQTAAQIARLETTIKKLEAKLDSGEKVQKDQQSQAYKAALSQIKTDVKTLVQSEPDMYEAIAKTSSIQDVVDLIEATFKEEGRLMSVEEAAEEVENYLSDEAFKLSELKKVQQRRKAASTSAPTTQTQTPKQSQQPQTMKTLTNATASTRQLSAKERAILAFKGELGKG